MARRSSKSSSSYSLPSFVILLVIVGLRYWQKSHEKPQKQQGKSSHSRTRSSSNTTSKAPSGTRSGEGNLLLGNPTDAGKSADNFLLERPQYSMSFNHSRGGPNWVAWHTDSSDLGDTERGKFAPDPDLPADWQIRPTDYTGGGYDRGHMCPSGDRTSSRANNNATFYMSNMVPQTADLNQHVWADVENYLRDQIRAGNEIYEICGGGGTAKTIAGGKVAVPQVCWKVAVILPEGTNDLQRINANSRILTIVMPNVEDDRLKNGDWHAYLTNASKVERTMKLNLLSALPGDAKKALEAKMDSGN